MMRAKIVCTIGPASREPAMLRALIQAGMDVARLNFSHGSHEIHAETVQRIREVDDELEHPIGILGDLQGPKLRVGRLPEEGLELVEGEELFLTTRPDGDREGKVVPVQFSQLPEAVGPGDHILLDDGLLELQVLESSVEEVHSRVIVGGVLKSNKGMNLPTASLSIPAITEKDREDLRFAVELGVDWVGLSFVRTANEILDLKDLIHQHDPDCALMVIAKIEKPEAVKHIDEIIEAADGIMVARGDLGIETSPEEVPVIQKMIIQKCNEAGKPVITATQMLDSMIRNPRPTRAEASDVANAILDNTDAIMLSGETSIGKYPLESVKTMVKIAKRAEGAHQDAALLTIPLPEAEHRNMSHAVAHATCQTALDLKAAAIITPTVTGSTARLVSRYRPSVPIVAVTPSEPTVQQLRLVWGVYPLLAPRSESTDKIISDAVAAARRAGYVREGDLTVVTAGAGGYAPGVTNLMKVHVVE